MVVIMEKNATAVSIQNVLKCAQERGCVSRLVSNGDYFSIGILHSQDTTNILSFQGLDDVVDVIPLNRPYKLASREIQKKDSLVKVGQVTFGGSDIPVIAGPCAVESEKQTLDIAYSVKQAGADLFRGGAFKPRSSPYTFQGLGEKGLKILAKVRKETGLPIVTEVMDTESFELVEQYADLIQIGTRNMRNISLLKRAGESNRPILLKRAMSATLQEWLLAAEYIMERGNFHVILCERGVRTFVTHSRNTLDISVITAAKKESHLPIIVDPSHAAGSRDLVIPLALAATAAGAGGLMVEVHNNPSQALSDGKQSLYPDQFEQLITTIRSIHNCIKQIPWVIPDEHTLRAVACIN